MLKVPRAVSPNISDRQEFNAAYNTNLSRAYLAFIKKGQTVFIDKKYLNSFKKDLSLNSQIQKYTESISLHKSKSISIESLSLAATVILSVHFIADLV